MNEKECELHRQRRRVSVPAVVRMRIKDGLFAMDLCADCANQHGDPAVTPVRLAS